MRKQSTAKGRRRAIAGALFVLLAVVQAVAAHASLPRPVDPAAGPDLLTSADPFTGVAGFLVDEPAAVDVAGVAAAGDVTAGSRVELGLTAWQLERALEKARGAENRVRGYQDELVSGVTLGPALSAAFSRAYPLPRVRIRLTRHYQLDRPQF